MHALRKCYLLMLTIPLTSCVESPESDSVDQRSPCERLLDKVQSCTGGRPVFIGACPDDEAERLIEMSCRDIVIELKGE